MITDDIMRLLRNGQSITSGEIAKVISKPNPSVRRSLAKLMKAGEIEKFGKKPVKYQVISKPAKTEKKPTAIPVLAPKKAKIKAKRTSKPIHVPVVKVIEKVIFVEKPVYSRTLGETTAGQLLAAELYYAPYINSVRDLKIERKKTRRVSVLS